MIFHKDEWNGETTEYTLVSPPPFFANIETLKTSHPAPFKREFSSGEKIIDDEEHLGLNLTEDYINSLSAYDPKTGEISQRQFDPDDVKYLIISGEGASFDPAALSEFMKDNFEK